jgi:hypothetical protein
MVIPLLPLCDFMAGYGVKCTLPYVVFFLLSDSMASEFRQRGITQKKEYNIQNIAKV